MTVSASLLLFGHDDLLLRTRELVLRREDLLVRQAHTMREVKAELLGRRHRLLVLCHGISVVERQVALSLAASMTPETRSLVLESDVSGGFEGGAAVVLHTRSGPAGLRCTVQTLLANNNDGPTTHAEEKRAMALEGTVKWFNNAKGYGFLGRNDGGKDVFTHYSSIQADGYRSLSEGDPVTFEVVQGEKGPQADQVRVQRK